MFGVGLYVVITEKFCRGKSSLDILKDSIEGGAVAVQLREKDLSPDQLRNLAQQWVDLLQQYSNPPAFIINDYVDVALAVGADGVHLGQSDLPCEAARKLAPDLIIGVSSHNLEEAVAAQAAGASYVNIGPIFDTQTKEGVGDGLGVDLIKNISPHLKIPFTVMGGIKNYNIEQVLSVGARRIAMVTEITQSFDVVAKVARLQDTITNFGRIL